MTDGGNGSLGLIHSSEQKAKVANKLTGYKRTKEEINKTVQTKLKNGVYERLRKKINKICPISGIILDTYDSLTLASQQCAIPRSTLHLTLKQKTKRNGERFYAGGFEWKYKSE